VFIEIVINKTDLNPHLLGLLNPTLGAPLSLTFVLVVHTPIFLLHATAVIYVLVPLYTWTWTSVQLSMQRKLSRFINIVICLSTTSVAQQLFVPCLAPGFAALGMFQMHVSDELEVYPV
jgi:hypothetical protein